MTDEEKKQKLDWLKNLPLETIGHPPTKFSRACPCGSLLLIETVAGCERDEDEERRIWSWVDTHFAHITSLPEKQKRFSPQELYDFSLPVKFSRKGFEMFVREFGLEIHAAHSTLNNKKYTDKRGNVFVFAKFNQPCAVEGVAAVLLPSFSKVDVLTLEN